MLPEDNIQLGQCDLQDVVSMVAEVLEMGPDQLAVRERLLDGVNQLIPCQCPCTLLQLNRFYCEQGEVLRSVHIPKLPGGRITEAMLNVWLKHISRRDSPIERALHARAANRAMGVGCLHATVRRPPLVNIHEWRSTNEGLIAERFKIKHLMYLWVRFSHDDLWAFCIRRYSDEEQFTDRDFDLLIALGTQLTSFRRFWKGLDLSQFGLSAAEQTVLAYWIQYGDGSKEIAKRLEKSEGTIRKQTEAIREKMRRALDDQTLDMKAIVARLRQRKLST